MHRLNQALTQEFQATSITDIKLFKLNSSKASTFDDLLLSDSIDYYYSSACTFIEAIDGLFKGCFSWATVRLYYSCFYAARGILGTNSIGVFYNNKKPYSLEINQNESPNKESGTTHEVVYKVINRKLNIPELSQPIAGATPTDWLKEKREEANYKLSKLYDPNMPNHFNYTSSTKLCEAINSYITDIENKTYVYSYDESHAAIAFPLLFLKTCKERLSAKGRTLSDPDISYLSSINHELVPCLSDFLLTT